MTPASTIKLDTDGSLLISDAGRLVITASETVVESGRYAVHNFADDQHLAIALQSVAGGHRLVPLSGLDLALELNAPTSTNDRLRLMGRVKITLETLAPFRVSSGDITIVTNGDVSALKIKKVTRI